MTDTDQGEFTAVSLRRLINVLYSKILHDIVLQCFICRKV